MISHLADVRLELGHLVGLNGRGLLEVLFELLVCLLNIFFCVFSGLLDDFFNESSFILFELFNSFSNFSVFLVFLFLLLIFFVLFNNRVLFFVFFIFQFLLLFGFFN